MSCVFVDFRNTELEYILLGYICHKTNWVSNKKHKSIH